MRRALAPVILLLLFSFLGQGAFAQEALPPAPEDYVPPTEEQLDSIEGPARLAIYFDPIARSSVRAVEPGELFEFHLIAIGAEGGMQAWEARVLLDERIEIVEQEMVGMNLGVGEQVYQVGLVNRCLADQEITVLSYKARLREGDVNDVAIGLAPIPEGSFYPPAPGYLACEGDPLLQPFAWPERAAVVNPEQLQPSGGESDADKPRFEMESNRKGSQ